VNRSGFSSVTSLGVTRDADYPDDPAAGDEVTAPAAFQSVCTALAHVKLPVPTAPIIKATGNPNVSVFILPDCQLPGMLEDVCVASIQSGPEVGCMDDYFNCLARVTGRTHLRRNLAKSRVHAWLAAQAEPDRRLSEAAEAGYWNWDSPAFGQLKQFLSAL